MNLAVSQKNKEAIVAAGGHLQVLECMKKSAGNVCVCVAGEGRRVASGVLVCC